MVPRRKVFTLLVEMRCNSYCVFCGLRQVDEGLVRARARVGLSTPATRFGDQRGRYTLETAVAELRQARASGCTEVSLQGGEPTIFPEIVPLVREARAIGFDFVGIVTNARKLADPAFARDLIEAGIDGITGSLVGWNAETHDGTALAPGAFDELVRGLGNAAAAASRARRDVSINANVITSGQTVDHLPDQVRLLAAAGVRAAVVHLVRFDGMGKDPLIRESLRFDVRRLTPALDAARAEAARLGMSLHASDVPMCLHPRLDLDELRVLRRRAAVSEHHFRNATFGFDAMPQRDQPPTKTCDGCLLSDSCPRVPPGHLPERLDDALRAITPASVAQSVDDLLASLDPTDDGAARAVSDMARSVEVLGDLRPAADLGAASARLHEALLDLVRISHAGGRARTMVHAFWSYLGLVPPRFDVGETALAAPGWSASVLAERAGAVPVDQVGEGPRLRFGASFEVALRGERTGDAEMTLTGASPILRPVARADDRLYRALFVAAVCMPLRGARALRMLEDRVLVDGPQGTEIAWTLARRGAVTLSLS
jgi:molybdenum cofactor biosynthesis enzyme MoaA